MTGFRAILRARLGWLFRDRRASKRRVIMASSTIFWTDHRHLGLIRDISDYGLFLYSDFTPAIGDKIRVQLKQGFGTTLTSFLFTGVVHRVGTPRAGAATGIAIRIVGCVPNFQVDMLPRTRL
jgi:hypothetical protein